jgi:hypothetical protein
VSATRAPILDALQSDPVVLSPLRARCGPVGATTDSGAGARHAPHEHRPHVPCPPVASRARAPWTTAPRRHCDGEFAFEPRRSAP